MKILTENIINPAFGITASGTPDRNAICGMLLPSRSPVRFERRISGWKVNLRITVDGVCVHDTEAEADERIAFDTLAERARRAQFEFEEIRRDSARVAARRNLFDLGVAPI